MLSQILGACLVIYVGAYLLRWVVKGGARLTGISLAPHTVRYATIGASTVLLILLVALGQSRLAVPDYSLLWVYAVGGLIVFSMSVGHSYWAYRRSMRATDSLAPESARMTEMGLAGRVGSLFTRDAEEGENEYEYEEWEEWYGWLVVALLAFLVVTLVLSGLFGVEPEAIAWLLLAPFAWLTEGFLTAITNPYYLGGLFVGLGTGWILRGAVSK